MLKHLLLSILLLASFAAHAEIFMCKSPSGETAFSDTPCKAGSASSVVPDNEHLTQQQQDDAQRKLQQQRLEASESAAQRSASQVDRQVQSSAMPAPAAPPADEVYEGGGCVNSGRRDTNCAVDPYRRPVPDRGAGPRPRPVPR